jgi:hypothetical protein
MGSPDADQGRQPRRRGRLALLGDNQAGLLEAPQGDLDLSGVDLVAAGTESSLRRVRSW